jgi:hypothetical protein
MLIFQSTLRIILTFVFLMYSRQEINEINLNELQNELKNLNITIDCVTDVSPSVL